MIAIDVQKRFTTMEMKFSMELAANRTILFGPSGSGKSTLLKLLTGFCVPDRGRISIGDTVIFDAKRRINLPVHLRQVGYLPQDYTLFPHLSVQENILYGLKARRIIYTEKEFSVIVARLGIEGKLSARPSELSGGQQQRVALARIMLIQPRILLLDEPFSALDNTVRESLRELVMELCEDSNTPALLVTHDLEEALVFGQEIFIIQDGRELEHGRAQELFEAPSYVETAELFDYQIWPISRGEGANFITAKGERFTIHGSDLEKKEFVCIRPENIMLIREDRPVSEKLRENIIDGTVVGLHHRAHYVRIVFLSTRGEQYLFHTPKHVIRVMNIYQGKRCKISLKKESLVLCETCH